MSDRRYNKNWHGGDVCRRMDFRPSNLINVHPSRKIRERMGCLNKTISTRQRFLEASKLTNDGVRKSGNANKRIADAKYSIDKSFGDGNVTNVTERGGKWTSSGDGKSTESDGQVKCLRNTTHEADTTPEDESLLITFNRFH
ncbi:uncharacterized protein LOC127849059 [Dreissena polymorpha]|uniref:uncharacterized protein LOC127849059 n=1 Tax=Dreissena polymorpha TaxID=45954 RepID=UPI002264F05D|nr:uncharacterized protein LOC127849059 [Dreissena polymorpha]